MANNRKKGQGTGGRSKTSKIMVRAVEREGQAVALRLAGRTLVEIAEALGYRSKTGVATAITRALKRIGSQEVEEYREINTARLEKIVATWWPVMIAPVIRVDGREIINEVATRLKATELILRAITDMRALHGLDIAKIPAGTPEDPFYVAPAVVDVKLTPEQVEALVALDPALQSLVIDEQGNDVGRNGDGG